MGAVELDRQGIERRDFPIVRRGYDPASVDAHLRALAAEVDDLKREAGSRSAGSSGTGNGFLCQSGNTSLGAIRTPGSGSIKPWSPAVTRVSS